MLGRRAAWLAGLAVAGDPFLVFFSSLLLTETLFVGALIWLWGLMWWRLRSAEPGGWRSWLTIGGLAALCIYVRESSAGLMVLMLAVAALMKVVRRPPAGPVAGWLMRLGGAGAVVVLALLPWAARNASVTGDWCWLTHRGGISLYDGVGPQAQGDSNLGDIKQMPAVAGLDEVAWNRFFLDESWRAIREDPARIARLAVVKWQRLWNPPAQRQQLPVAGGTLDRGGLDHSDVHGGGRRRYPAGAGERASGGGWRCGCSCRPAT